MQESETQLFLKKFLSFLYRGKFSSFIEQCTVVAGYAGKRRL